MSTQFVAEVRRRAVTWPTRRGFSQENWAKAFEQSQDHSEAATNLFKVGSLLFKELEAIRNVLKRNYGSTKATLIQGVYSLVSRETSLIWSKIEGIVPKEGEPMDNLLSTRLPLYGGVNSAGADDITETVVEAAAKAISHLDSLDPSVFAAQDDDDLSSRFQDIRDLLWLGSHYDWIESIWANCLWKNYQLENNGSVATFSYPKTEKDRIRAISTHRNDALTSQNVTILARLWKHDFSEEHKQKVCHGLKEAIVTRNGQGFTATVGNPLGIPESPPLTYALLLRMEDVHLNHLFSEELSALEGATLNELLTAWEAIRTLALAALPFYDRTLVLDGKSALTFCQNFEFYNIRDYIQAAMSLDRKRAGKILKCVISKSNDKELFLAPFVDRGNNILTFFPAIAWSANILRNIEQWLRLGKFNLEVRGNTFEIAVRSEIADMLKESQKIRNASVVPSAFKFMARDHNNYEQVDLILRIGSTVLIGEVKCWLRPGEPADEFRYYEKIEEAIDQVHRKVVWLREHWSECTKPDELNGFTECPTLMPVVITNQVAGVGYHRNGVPITDLTLLRAFLVNGKTNRWVILRPDGSEEVTQKLFFYQNESEAEKSLPAYLLDPPQISVFRPFLADRSMEGLDLKPGQLHFRTKYLTVDTSSARMPGFEAAEKP